MQKALALNWCIMKSFPRKFAPTGYNANKDCPLREKKPSVLCKNDKIGYLASISTFYGDLVIHGGPHEAGGCQRQYTISDNDTRQNISRKVTSRFLTEHSYICLFICSRMFHHKLLLPT